MPEPLLHPPRLKSVANGLLKFDRWQFAWLIVFALNLILPLQLGLDATRSGGRTGMWVAIVLFWLIGHWCCGLSKVIALISLRGGLVVALSQICPFVQFGAGMTSFTICGVPFHDHGYPPTLSEFQGFAVTAVTGGILLVIVAIWGVLFRIAWKDVPD